MPIFLVNLLKYWKPIAIGLIVLLVFFAGVRYESASCTIEKQELIDKYTAMIQEEVDRRHKISAEYEERLAELRGQSRQIIEKVEVEIVKPIYKECKVPDSGLNLINDTIDLLNRSRKQ